MKKAIITTIFGLSLLTTSCYNFKGVAKIDAIKDLTGDSIADVLTAGNSNSGNRSGIVLYVGNKDGTFTRALEQNKGLFYIGENGMDYVRSYKNILKPVKFRELVNKKFGYNTYNEVMK
jgi:hypothetical protein